MTLRTFLALFVFLWPIVTLLVSGSDTVLWRVWIGAWFSVCALLAVNVIILWLHLIAWIAGI